MVNRILNKIVFVSMVFFVGVVVAYIQSVPNSGHGGDSVLVVVDGFKMTLQDAINNGFLVDGAPSPTKHYIEETPNPGHSAEHIFVSVDGSEKTLQQAISSSLCGSGSHSYSSEIVFGHSADEILVSVGGSEMSLQDAINGGEFCCVSDCVGKECGDDGCGGSCGTCGSYASCPSGTCVCDAGWDDCNNDNTCECDLSTYECDGGSCVSLCTVNRLYQRTDSGRISSLFDFEPGSSLLFPIGRLKFLGYACSSGSTPLYLAGDWFGSEFVRVEPLDYPLGMVVIGYTCETGSIPLYAKYEPGMAGNNYLVNVNPAGATFIGYVCE